MFKIRWHGVRTLIVVIAAGGLLAAAAGCEKKSASRGGAGVEEVRLGYFANLTHAQALLGVHSGDYAKAVAPAKLTTRVFNAGPSLTEALFAGEIDIGYVGPGPAINAFVKSRGTGLRIISGAAANGVVIVVRGDSGIEKLEDLKGRKIATPQHGNTQDVSARHFLIATLGQADANNVIPIANGEQATMMARGQIDAAWAPEPWGARMVADAGARIIAEEKELWPGKEFGLTLVITTPEFLAAHRDIVKRLLEAHRGWTERLAAEPQKYAPDLSAAIASLTGKPLPQPLLVEALGRVRFTDDPLPDSLDTFARWAHELRFLREKPDLTGLVDTSLLGEIAP